MPSTAPDQGFQGKQTIFIVDDHPVLRRGLTALIESESDLAVCGEAATCQAALTAIHERQPDLVIVDIVLEGYDGLDLIKQMKARLPTLPALVLSMYDEMEYAERALRVGASGYVSKQQLDATLLVAIRRLLRGKIHLSAQLEARLASKFVSGQTLEPDSPLNVLSNRQLQVFRMIGQGRSTRQISETLHLSIKTIESHREHIKHKLAIETAAELAQRATQWVETGRSGG